MVHHEELRCACETEAERLLPASKGQFCRNDFVTVCFSADAFRLIRTILLTINSALFLTYLILSLYSLIPSRSSKRSIASDPESQEQRPWEMAQVPPTPGTTGGLKSPMTPRTTAFNTLSGKMGGAGGAKGKGKFKGKGKDKGKEPVRGPDGKLPLRHHISMGDETYQGPAGEAVQN